MKNLIKMLEAFLKKKSESQNGGFAKVSEGEIEDLYKIILRILELKYEKDADGDIPVDFRLVDRTRFEPLHYIPVPYEHQAKNDKERMDILSTLNLNLLIASQGIDRHIRILDMIRRDKEKSQ